MVMDTMKAKPESAAAPAQEGLNPGAADRDAPASEAHGAEIPAPGARRLREVVLTCLDDDKAQDIIEIDLSAKSSVTDVMIIASGRSQRHVAAIADHALRAMKNAGAKSVRVEGLASADWVLIDAGDVLVHLFRPEVREFYNLEKLWDADATHAASPDAAAAN